MRKNTNRNLVVAMAALASAPLAGVANADVSLEWRTTPQVVSVGNTFSIGLYAVSDTPTQNVSAVDTVLNWDSSYLDLISITNDSPYSWASSSLPDDCGLDALNADPVCPLVGTITNDGNAFYSALGAPGSPAVATAAGLLVATFNFQALATTPSTLLTIPAMAGLFTESVVVSGDTAGLPVTGSLGFAQITIVPEPATLAFAAFGVLALVRRRRIR